MLQVKVEKPETTEESPALDDIQKNPWNIVSLYALLYYNCPSCDFRHSAKQDFVTHALDSHSECIPYLRNIKDDSMRDVSSPWNLTENFKNETETTGINIHCDVNIKVKNETNEEVKRNLDENAYGILDYEDTFDNDTEFFYNDFEDIEYDEEHDFEGGGNDFQMSDQGDWKCDLCEKHFCNKGDVKRHVKSVHEKKLDFKCDQCERAFSRSHVLKRHIELVHDPNKVPKVKKVINKLQCSVCDGEFKGRRPLKAHMKTEHPELLLKNYICPTCGKTFKRPETMRNHIKSVHEGLKEYKCEVCFKEFSLSGNLWTHIRSVHEKQRDFKCDQCPASFFQSNGLQKHIKSVHEGQRDFKCHFCGSLFAAAGNLRQHIQCVHEKLREHKCDFCEKSFFSSGEKKKHIEGVHEKRNEYKCDRCEKAFSYARALRRHIKAVHEGIKDHECDICGKAFSRLHHLRDHLKSIHKHVFIK